jgi:N-acetylneuraminic acid mutarotase
MNKYSTEYLAILVWLYGIDEEKYNKVVEDICEKIYDDYEWKSEILGYDFLNMHLSEDNKYANELFDLFHQESKD